MPMPELTLRSDCGEPMPPDWRPGQMFWFTALVHICASPGGPSKDAGLCAVAPTFEAWPKCMAFPKALKLSFAILRSLPVPCCR